MRHVLITLLTLTLFSMPLLSYMSRGKTKDEKIVNYIIEKTTIELEHNFGLYKVGDGIAGIDIIKEIYIALSIDSPLNKNQARELMVNSAQIFIKNINNNKQIQPYLITSPFQIKNIEIDICCYYPNRERVYFPLVHNVSLLDGEIIFRTKDQNKEFGYKTEEVETYEEALKLVQNNE
jgi:hypothetical protein